MSNDDKAAFDELSYYTLAHGREQFIHQHVVDAFTAQHAESANPVGVAFSLIGLCLYVEHGASGREVQEAHMALAKKRRPWPSLALPADGGSVTVHDVLAAPAGPARDEAIGKWCESVWAVWSDSHAAVRALLEENLQ